MNETVQLTIKNYGTHSIVGTIVNYAYDNHRDLLSAGKWPDARFEIDITDRHVVPSEVWDEITEIKTKYPTLSVKATILKDANGSISYTTETIAA